MLGILSDVAERPSGQLVDIVGVRCFDELQGPRCGILLNRDHIHWPHLRQTHSCEGQNLINNRLIVIAVMLGGMALAQTTPPGGAANAGIAKSSPSSGQFGSSAVWHPAPDFLTTAHAACD